MEWAGRNGVRVLYFLGSQQSSASAEFGDIARQSSTDGWDVPSEADRDIAQLQYESTTLERGTFRHGSRFLSSLPAR
jgi:hypothetical protein